MKKKNIYQIPIVTISTYGHCGIDWLHTLIDSHKQVLIFPPMSFFRKFYVLKKKKIYLDKILDSRKIVDIFINNFLSLKKNHVFLDKTNKKVFTNYMIDFLVSENIFPIEKKLCCAAHYAYARTNKIDLNKIKAIVAHEHAPWHCIEYSKYFNSKFIFMVRDPRATIAGSLRTFKRHLNVPKNFSFDITLSFMLSAFDFCNRTGKNKMLILRNEDMVKNLKPEMKKVSKWLKIKFNKSMLNSTIVGKKWLGESAYLAKGDLKKKPSKNYYKPINIELRWRNFLYKKDILAIETIYEKIMKKNRYVLDNKLNFFSKLQGHAIGIFSYQDNNFFSFNPIETISFIKNILRRFFIIFFTNLSRKIFDIQ